MELCSLATIGGRTASKVIESAVAHLQEHSVLRTAIITASVVTASVMLFHGFTDTDPSTLIGVTPVSDTSPSFAWSGTVPDGGWLKIRDLAGTIEVRRAPGNTVDVRATQEPGTSPWAWIRGPVQAVRFVTQRQGSEVVICAVSDDKPSCDANDLSSPHSGWNAEWRPQPMHIVIQLPAGISLQAGTMHGDLSITDAGAAVIARSGHGTISIRNVAGTITANTGHGDLDILNAAKQVTARTGHGNIHVSSAGAVRANTGHGDIVANLTGIAGGSNDMMFETGHGNVSVVAPKALNGDVDLNTGRGSVSSDFPLTISDQGRHSRTGSEHGILGSGGRSVRLSTGHGDISLTTAG
jgi:putative adhesin